MQIRSIDKPFVFERAVRIAHTDAAGHLFFPSYFVLANDAIDYWLTTMGYSLSDALRERREGFPVVHACCDYSAPAALGDNLAVTVLLRKLGRSSLTLDLPVECGGEARARVGVTIVQSSFALNRSIEIAGPFRATLERYKATCDAAVPETASR